MWIYGRIAFRNIRKSAKRSFLIGSAIFISCFILLVSNAIGNASKNAILNEYYHGQAGDVVLVWENSLEIERDSPSRIYLSEFDPKKNVQNKAALATLAGFLKEHKEEVKQHFAALRGTGVVSSAGDQAVLNLQGMGKAEARYLAGHGLLEIEEGRFGTEPDSGAAVSRFVASVNGWKVGDWINIECTSAYGAKNSLDYRITAIYKNGIPWNNDCIYLSEADMRQLYNLDPPDFNSMRIYLRDPGQSAGFARRLDRVLTQASPVLRALPGSGASTFFTSQAELVKSMFTFFVVFLIFVIGFGIRATVRMNLFERMKEFGTLRAIGFSRRQIFMIIFLEIFLLALLALTAALVTSTACVLVLSKTGVYVGSGAAGYIFAGDYIHPVFEAADAVFALFIVFLLSLFSPFKPGLKLCFQKITNSLRQRQEKTLLTVLIAQNIIRTKRHAPGREDGQEEAP